MSLKANIELGICSDGCDWDPADCFNCGYCHYEHEQELKEKEQKFKERIDCGQATIVDE